MWAYVLATTRWSIHEAPCVCVTAPATKQNKVKQKRLQQLHQHHGHIKQCHLCLSTQHTVKQAQCFIITGAEGMLVKDTVNQGAWGGRGAPKYSWSTATTLKPLKLFNCNVQDYNVTWGTSRSSPTSYFIIFSVIPAWGHQILSLYMYISVRILVFIFVMTNIFWFFKVCVFLAPYINISVSKSFHFYKSWPTYLQPLPLWNKTTVMWKN